MSILLRTLPLIPIFSKPRSLITFSLYRTFKLSPHNNTKTLLRTTNPTAKSISTAVSASSSSTTPETATTLDPTQLPGVTTTTTTTSGGGANLEWVSRTGLCGQLSETDVGKRVRLCGWVSSHRIHGGLTFLNLRDHTGIVQVTTLPDKFPDAHSTVNELRLEYVIAVEGIIRPRPSESVNSKMITGMIEVAAEHVQVLNAVRAKLPFLVTTADDAKDSTKEEIRLRLMLLDIDVLIYAGSK